MTPWITPDEAIELNVWTDAVTLGPTALAFFLEVAQEACAAYAPPISDDVVPPARYKLAVVYHARDLQSNAATGVELVGPDAYPLRVRPLSDAVKALLRPYNPTTSFGANGDEQAVVNRYGLDGKSAYQLAVDEGFVGTLEDYLDSLQGPAGVPGSNALMPTANGAAVDLPDADPIGTVRGYVVTATTVIEGTTCGAGTWIFVKEGAGWKGYQAGAGAPPLTEVSASSPTWNDSAGTFTVPTITGVDYKVGSSVVTGTVTVSPTPQTVTVTAVAKAGYTIVGTSSWTHAFPAAQATYQVNEVPGSLQLWIDASHDASWTTNGSNELTAANARFASSLFSASPKPATNLSANLVRDPTSKRLVFNGTDNMVFRPALVGGTSWPTRTELTKMVTMRIPTGVGTWNNFFPAPLGTFQNVQFRGQQALWAAAVPENTTFTMFLTHRASDNVETIWVDGVNRATGTVGFDGTFTGVVLGKSDAAANQNLAEVCEVAEWNAVLTQAQIEALHRGQQQKWGSR